MSTLELKRQATDVKRALHERQPMFYIVFHFDLVLLFSFATGGVKSSIAFVNWNFQFANILFD